ncbi:MAG: choice-of-anchor Q domain-containing protein [Marinicella sp.]
MFIEKSKNNTRLILKALLLTTMVIFSNVLLAGGGTTCDSVNSGLWSDVNTWNCNTGSGLPGGDTSVDVNSPHTVTLNQNVTIDRINLNSGATLVVGASATGYVMQLSASFTDDFDGGDIELLGDFTVERLQSSGIDFGAVNGGFNFSVIGDGAIDINEEIGSITPLNSVFFQTNSEIDFSANVSTTGSQQLNGKVRLVDSMALTASEVIFNETIYTENTNPDDAALTINGNAVFNANIGNNFALLNESKESLRGDFLLISDLSVSGTTTTGANVTGITTRGTQDYTDKLNINNDLILTTTEGGSINLRGSGGAHDLTLDATGNVFMVGTIGNPRHQSLTAEADGLIFITGGGLTGAEVRVEGTAPTSFNGDMRVGPGGNLFVDQTGPGNVVFNGNLFTFSGGSKFLTVNDVSGQTIFNGTVNLGRVTTNDGAGDDVTVINSSLFMTDRGGSSNGVMTFNDPVRVATNTTFREIDDGRIRFNNTLDALDGMTEIELTLESTNEVNLGPVGTLQPFYLITTDSGGSTTVRENVGAGSAITFNDDVILNDTTTISSENITFNAGINLQTSDLHLSSFSSEVNGAINGSGDLSSFADNELTLNALSTFTGRTVINFGNLDMNLENNIPNSSEIVIGSSSILNTNIATGIFRLADGQTLSGDGDINGSLLTDSGSTLSPGDAIGLMSSDDLQMFTGSTFQIEINGTNSGMDSDQLTISSVELDQDMAGGATLEIVTQTIDLQLGDEITIIDNSGFNPSSGTFNGLQEGATLIAQGLEQEFAISYVGGDGNDVVLTVTNNCINPITVTDGGDSGPGTLRQAVASLCDGGVISFEADLMVTLTTEIVVDKTVDINGNGFNVTLSGNNTNRMFNIDPFGHLSLFALNVIDGYSTQSGGAILNNGRLDVFDSTFSGNVSDRVNASGGAIFIGNGAFSSINNSSFNDNDGAVGGAIYIENGLLPGAMVSINSTFTQNGDSSSQGGAVYNAGTVLSYHSTFAANGGEATSGGSLYTINGDLTLNNTLIADHIGADDCFIDLGNSTQNNTASLIETGNCDAAITDDPQLRPLADNGGNTLTIYPQLTSPALNAGHAGPCSMVDQRGVSRPQFGACDIGAVEAEYLGLIHVGESINDGRGELCSLGTCWDNPYPNLQDALTVAGEGSEVWVQQGVYYPDEGMNQVDNNRNSTFDIPSGVSLYGGFFGNETELSQRDLMNNVTILSGDIDGNDTNTDGNFIAESTNDLLGANAFNVLFSEGGLVLDGFTITAGRASGGGSESDGAGLNCIADPEVERILSNNTWSGNRGSDEGGAVYQCGALIQNSLFRGNNALNHGAAVFDSNGSTIVNSVFTQNQASDDGGAIYGENITIDLSSFTGNRANRNGGALRLTGGVNQISNTVMTGNRGDFRGGAINNSASTLLTNVTMTGNEGEDRGGAIFDNSGSDPSGSALVVQNSIIWNNQSDDSNSAVSPSIRSQFGRVPISHSLVALSGGSANWNSSMGIDGGNNLDIDPQFITPVNPNIAPTTAGDVRLMTSSPAIDAGDDSLAIGDLDLDGEDRISGLRVDMGAYEVFAETYTIGGTVFGLATGNAVVLQNNAVDDFIVSADGSFTFSDVQLDASNYDVQVIAQPTSPNQICTVTNGAGNINGANITDIIVTCVIETYTIGGSIIGLASGNSVTLQNNGGDDLVVSGNGSFTFATALEDGSGYSVSVLTQPSSPNQTCVVSSGSGVVSGENVTAVSLLCINETYMVGGSISGLASSNSATLQNNGMDDLTLKNNGTFVFFVPISDGSGYNVTVSSQPTSPNQMCTASNGSGTINGDDVADVSVLCVTVQYFVGGSMIGLLPGNSVVLEINNNDEITITEDGPFVFPSGLDDGSGFDVQVISEPTAPIQNCVVSMGSGAINGDDVTDLEVVCDNNDLIYKDGFEG